MPTLSERITAGFQAVAADVKALLVGKVNNDDQRLSDSREWTASVVSQAEAESGTSSTARKWTSQRVRQAIVAWWGTIGTAFGKSLLGVTDAAEARTTLGVDILLDAKFDKAGGWINGAIALGRTDSIGDGGEIAFARSLDNSGAFIIEVTGLTETPNLRFINVANPSALAPLIINGETGAVTTNTPGGIGYGPGAGGTVVQPTSKSTTVTLNKPTGTIIMNNETMPPGTTIRFYCANSTLLTGGGFDVVVARLSAQFLGDYRLDLSNDGAWMYFAITNISNISLSDNVTISYAVIKGSAT